MQQNEKYRNFLSALKNPRVFPFIFVGVAVIFLTFLTRNNALEIVISGIASVFIGIGVNNFSSLETRMSDERQLKKKIVHALKVVEITRSRIKMINDELQKDNILQVKKELTELEQIIDLSAWLLKDEEQLD